MQDWTLVYDHFDPAEERLREALCTLGNGYFANPISRRWIADTSYPQRHVNSAIAYNIWQYYQATRDKEFLFHHGAEMILEMARFWASLATYNRDLERYEVRGVMGPDKHHDQLLGTDVPGLNNNAYTNIMAMWTVPCGLKILDLLAPDQRQHLCRTLNLRHEELVRWHDMTRRMRLVFHGDGIISQFEGYADLEEFDWQG